MIENKNVKVRIVFDRKHVATSSKAKLPKKGLVQIELYDAGRRRFITTGIKLYSDQWDEHRELHVVNSAFSDEYNSKLRNMVRELLEQINEGASIDSMATSDKRGKRTTTFYELGMDVINSMYNCKPSSIISTQELLDRVRRYMGDWELKRITIPALEKLDRLMVEHGLSSKTRHITFVFVGRVLNVAEERKLIGKNPYLRFTKPRARSAERTYLTEEEIVQIAQAKMPKRYAPARDLFVFQCYTGISFSDTQTLNASMIAQENGKWYIVRLREKTNQRYRIMLFGRSLEIIKRYGMTLPKLRNRNKYNYHLLKVTKYAGISKHITSHVGRHSFATMALSRGIPIEIVSKMLGHTNIQTTQIYAKILAKDVDAQFERLADMIG